MKLYWRVVVFLMRRRGCHNNVGQIALYWHAMARAHPERAELFHALERSCQPGGYYYRAE